ncbi:hypothetical protein M0813_03061 [Anaeramoeba flamelloides]|uniref:Uncharacterized protein n=1 Tax=Anaeramoeba flamelloides TaxID=1746091 RepID=A0ABQ8Y7J5_9EUKA|nr:hypothetical protein M0813_03061 [Anaeramoeba flamelloides]
MITFIQINKPNTIFNDDPIIRSITAKVDNTASLYTSIYKGKALNSHRTEREAKHFLVVREKRRATKIRISALLERKKAIPYVSRECECRTPYTSKNRSLSGLQRRS